MFSFEVVNSVHLSNFFMKYFWLRGYIRLPQKGPTQFYKLFFLGGGGIEKSSKQALNASEVTPHHLVIQIQIQAV